MGKCNQCEKGCVHLRAHVRKEKLAHAVDRKRKLEH